MQYLEKLQLPQHISHAVKWEYAGTIKLAVKQCEVQRQVDGSYLLTFKGIKRLVSSNMSVAEQDDVEDLIELIWKFRKGALEKTRYWWDVME